jgi:hypothetical protein
VTASLNVEVVGAKEALRQISKFDRDLGLELRRNARDIMKPIVQDAKSNIPTVALSGWSRPWTSKKTGAQLLPWSGSTAKTYVKAKTSTKKPTEFAGMTRDLAAFYVSWAGGVNAIFDMAGRKNNSVMAANLTGKFGPPSRIMWPAAQKNAPQVEAEMAKINEQLMIAYNRILSKGSL